MKSVKKCHAFGKQVRKIQLLIKNERKNYAFIKKYQIEKVIHNQSSLENYFKEIYQDSTTIAKMKP